MIDIWRQLPSDKKPYLLFTDVEERGGIGAREASTAFANQLKESPLEATYRKEQEAKKKLSQAERNNLKREYQRNGSVR